MVPEKRSFVALEAGSWLEAAVALAPFLLVGVLPALLALLGVPFVHTRAMGTLVSGWVVLSLILCVVGLVRGLPRWALPYGGMVLSLLALFSTRVSRGFLDKLYSTLVSPSAPWVLRQIVSSGRIWAGMLLVELALIVLIVAAPPAWAALARVRRDWTLLAFGLYGSAILALMFEFEGYVHHEPYLLAAMATLIVCGWLYLRSARPWQRALSLVAGIALATAVAAVGKAIVYARSGWRNYPELNPETIAVSTLITGGWLVLAIVAPIIIALLSHPALGTTERADTR